MGSGSNLLVADAGVRGLVLKLDQELSQITVDGTRIDCGGGARLPAVSAQAARAGLSGIEFGVNIPGTVGGAVRMNANAYGGELARALEWVDVASAAGTERRTPDELGFAYRRSGLHAGRGGGARRRLRWRRCLPRMSSARWGRCAPSAARPSRPGSRRSARRSRIRPTPGPRDARAGQLLEAAGCRGLRVGGAGFSAKHANFVENLGDATTADVVALMAEGRRRVKERFGVELEPEVQALGPVSFPGRLGHGR